MGLVRNWPRPRHILEYCCCQSMTAYSSGTSAHYLEASTLSRGHYTYLPPPVRTGWQLQLCSPQVKGLQEPQNSKRWSILQFFALQGQVCLPWRTTRGSCRLLELFLSHPDSSLRYRRYINHLLTYLLTFCSLIQSSEIIEVKYAMGPLSRTKFSPDRWRR